jgi:hypothetical protein
VLAKADEFSPSNVGQLAPFFLSLRLRFVDSGPVLGALPVKVIVALLAEPL